VHRRRRGGHKFPRVSMRMRHGSRSLEGYENLSRSKNMESLECHFMHSLPFCGDFINEIQRFFCGKEVKHYSGPFVLLYYIRRLRFPFPRSPLASCAPDEVTHDEVTILISYICCTRYPKEQSTSKR
jgi:hypothetical protein